MSSRPYQHSIAAAVAIAQKQKLVFERGFLINDTQSSLIKEIISLLLFVPSVSLECASLRSSSKTTIGWSFDCSSS